MSALAQGFGRLRALSAALAAGETTPEALLEQALGRIEAVDGTVRAFLSVGADGARATAAERGRELAAGRSRGPLHGIPFAVKDVIDVAGLPTRAGSRARADAAPATLDATVVARLKAAGAVLVGKVHTTEFAYFTGVPPTRNPHDPGRTPGGSSGGSAAAVASGAVPLALGTQTAGSINRPASFCGVGAFKPSGLSVVGAGVTPFAPSFDTVGPFAETAADAAFALAAFAPEGLALDTPRGPAVAGAVVLEDPVIEERAGAEMAAALADAAREIGESGLSVRHGASPVPFTDLLAAHRTVMMFELGRVHGALLERRDLVDPDLAAGIEEGRAIGEGRYLDALGALAAMRAAFWAALPLPSVVVLPAATGPAPQGMPTGDPVFVTVMTALAGPVATVRAGCCPATGMPLGAMVGAPPGRDADLAAALLAAREGPLSR